MIRSAPLPFLLLLLAAACAAPARVPPARAPESPPSTFVVVHGAWGGGWAWATVDSLLTREGHTLTRPTLTGLGERVHLASPETDLTTHITDVVNHLIFEELDEVVLVGHSYGGIVAMGVAHRVPERIARIILLDAFLPEDGESVIDLARGTALEEWTAGLVAGAEDGRITPSWMGPPESWPGDVPHPLATWTQPVALGNPAAERIPAAYILTATPGSDPADDLFAAFAGRAEARGWEVRVLPGDHVPYSSSPAPLVQLLLDLVR